MSEQSPFAKTTVWVAEPLLSKTRYEGTQWRIRRLLREGGSGYYVAVLE